MKKGLLLLIAVLALMMIPFVTLSHAAIGDYDLSDPKDGDVDGSDLAAFIASSGSDIAGFAGAFGQTYTVSTRLPNILLIIADDVGVDVTSNLYPGLISELEGVYGVGSGVKGNPAHLPVLTDRLAAQGMVFRNAWAQPYCSPSRATVITGLFEYKTQVKGPSDPMKATHTFFVKKLHDDANYSTAMIGKWHLAGGSPYTSGTLPKQAGFDYYYGHNDAYIPSYWSYPVHWQDSTTSPSSFNTIAAASVPARTLAGIASTKYAPVVKGAAAIDWINARQAADPNKPWFVWLAFNLSHVTTQNPNMHVPNADTLDSDTKNELNTCLGTSGKYGVDPPQVGQCTGPQLMRAMTNAMDTVIGKVLDAVDAIPSDTYVIFIGDNGTPWYGSGYGNQIDNMYITKTGRGKGSAWESGCRVPMAIRGPNIAAGGQNDAPVHLADLFATILTMAGVTPPAQNYDNTGAPVNSDSKSLTPILFGSANDTDRDPNAGYLLTETNTMSFGTRWVGARNATYKVLCNLTKSSCDFYNLIANPLEEGTGLTKPANCTNYTNGTWTPANQEWHYCRLMEVINTYSIIKSP
jgi:arylsulfatase A-like enzyme